MSDGTGEPLVLVHGSWSDHTSWNAIVPGLAEAFQVVRYDRRGHSRSPAPPGQGSFLDDVADAAALIEELGLAPAHVLGNSYGSSIALRLAGERPGLVRRVVAHEPSLLGFLRATPEGRSLEAALHDKEQPIVRLVEAGQFEEAARRFIEDIALGPGAWERLPDPTRKVLAGNAPTFVDELKDPANPEVADPDALGLDAVRCPVLLSGGSTSPPFFATILEGVAGRLVDVTRHTYEGAGHVPHLSHPDELVERVTAFLREGR